MRRLLLLLILLFLGTTTEVYAETATDFVKMKTELFTSVLDNPKFKPESMKDEQRDALWKVIRHSFNYRQISQRALGRNWRKFSKNEKDLFVDLFTQLIGKTYLKTIQKNYTGERFVYKDERMIKKDNAQVRTVMVSKQYGNIPIDYTLRKSKGKWSVYDIKVENVSLVKNYRVQFRGLLRNKKPADLIKILDEKVKENESKN